MIANLLSTPTTTMLEQMLSFTEQRHQVLVEDIANGSTPGFVQKDLPVDRFQAALRKAVRTERSSLNDDYEPASDETFTFAGSKVAATPVEVTSGVAFHDRGLRSMEYIMSQLADNAEAHNMTAQLLKFQNDMLSRAISMKV